MKNKRSVEILLNTMDKVNKFNKNVMMYSDRCLDIVSGRYKVDAKSLMGLFSLDLSAPVTLEYNSDFEDEVIKLFGEFIVKV